MKKLIQIKNFNSALLIAIITCSTSIFGGEENTQQLNQINSVELEKQLETKTFIERQISLAELHELINKINEDLSSRLSLLATHPDKEEIIAVLKNKAKNLIKHLEEIEAIADPNYSKQSSIKPWQKKALLGVGIATTTLLVIALFLAAYDKEIGLTAPSWKRLKDNIFQQEETVPPTKENQHPPQEHEEESSTPVEAKPAGATQATEINDTTKSESNPLPADATVIEKIEPPAPQKPTQPNGWGHWVRAHLPF